MSFFSFFSQLNDFMTFVIYPYFLALIPHPSPSGFATPWMLMATNGRKHFFKTERAQAADMEWPGFAWQPVAVGSASFALLSLLFLPVPHWQPATLLWAPCHCHRWAYSAGIEKSCMRIKCGHWKLLQMLPSNKLAYLPGRPDWVF